MQLFSSAAVWYRKGGQSRNRLMFPTRNEVISTRVTGTTFRLHPHRNVFGQDADAPKSTGPLNLFSHRPRKKEPFGSRRSAFIQGRSIIDSKDGGVPYSPNQRARRDEQKFSLSIRNPTEGA